MKEYLKLLFHRFPAIWIPLLYGTALLILSPLHQFFWETGGVLQYFVGKEMLGGNGYHGWSTYFWPPLFSCLIGLGSLFLPGFFAGKLISILASTAVLYILYYLAALLSKRENIGFWVQGFLALNPLYAHESLLAHNHMLASLFFVSGVYLFLRFFEQPTALRMLLAGFVCGLAGLSRYTSYVLILMPLSFFLYLEIRKAAKFAAFFWSSFSLISSPWWYFNYVYNGSPFYNMEYLNIFTGISHRLHGNLPSDYFLWKGRGMENLNGALDVIVAYPKEYISNFIKNIPQCIKSMSRGSLGFFIVPAILEGLITMKRKYSLILFGLLALYITMVSQAFVTSWYLLSWTILITVVAVSFIYRYFDKLQERYAILGKFQFRKFCMVILLVVNLFFTYQVFESYAREKNLDHPFQQFAQVTKALKEHDPDINSKVIMAIDPCWAYYAGSKYLASAYDYQGSISGFVSYRDISDRLRRYAQKYPSNMSVSDLKADYLVYTDLRNIPSWVSCDLPQFSFLLDPHSEKIPRNFKLIYQSNRVVVYQIDWNQDPDDLKQVMDADK